MRDLKKIKQYNKLSRLFLLEHRLKEILTHDRAENQITALPSRVLDCVNRFEPEGQLLQKKKLMIGLLI